MYGLPIGSCKRPIVSKLFRSPFDRLRLNIFGRPATRIRATATGQATDDANRHVVVADDLAAKSWPRYATRGQQGFFCFGYLIGLTGNKLDATGRAACVASASVKLIDFGIVGQRVD